MGKVKYPSKKEIHNQINTIVEQSQIFEIEQNQTGYVECKQVKRSFFSSNAATVAIAFAACIIVLIAIKPLMRSFNHMNITAMNSPKGEDVAIGDNRDDNGGNYMNNSTQPAGEQSTVDGFRTEFDDSEVWYGDEYIVYFKSCMPHLFYNNIEKAYIYDHYLLKSNQRKEELKKTYNELRTIDGTKVSADSVSDNTAIIRSVAAKNEVSMVKELINNKISFEDQYTVLERYMAESLELKAEYVQKNYMYANTFDTTKIAELSYNDILKNVDEDLDIMAAVIYNQTQEYISLGLTGISEKYMSKESIKAMLKEEDNWRLSNNGLIVYCNEYRTYDTYDTNTAGGVNTTYHNITYETFVFSNDKYDLLKTEYAK